MKSFWVCRAGRQMGKRKSGCGGVKYLQESIKFKCNVITMQEEKVGGGDHVSIYAQIQQFECIFMTYAYYSAHMHLNNLSVSCWDLHCEEVFHGQGFKRLSQGKKLTFIRKI